MTKVSLHKEPVEYLCAAHSLLQVLLNLVPMVEKKLIHRIFNFLISFNNYKDITKI